ncbi:serine/threonine-protein phosphatase [Pseudoflavonifractor sp. 60]|uniref:PP2C family protein-serine/threonine phosphatase n=1 Tax=Pseudoflavonifractor sp. 60 TaxID=2304576 RepID=UPI00136D25F6|nr:PP2C family serine/threonine-protein phosphatase [Pseudoflavonifractor sp. 60]NBI68325.1 serine/threonine-protein phosphatase [Pseudoflavonifractor sp. 60]
MGLFKLFSREKARPPESEPPAEESPAIRVANVQGQGERERQEDSFAIVNAADLELQETQGLLALVADGMGGMEDGKAASQWAAECFLQLFQKRESEDIPDWFYRSVHTVSDSVFQCFGGRSGTTLVAVHIRKGLLHWLSVGDSGIFLMRNGGVFQLNREHTCLNQLLSQELEREPMDKQRALSDPDAPRLTSFVGIDRLAEVDLSLRPMELQRGDVLLLCSDGISGVLTPPELMECMSLKPEEGCALLEQMVLEKGVLGQDNYTGVLIAYQSSERMESCK